MRFFRKGRVVVERAKDAAAFLVENKLDLVQADLMAILNNGILPEDNLNAEEYEVTFTGTGAADTQNIPHTLQRIPLRVEVVRADQGGVVYTVAQSDTDVDVETTAVGTYRIRIS